MRKPVRLAAAVLVLLAGCATTTRDPLPGAQQRSGAQQQRTEGGAIVRGPALVEELLPARLADRRGWAEDMYAALSALRVEPTAENVCAVIAVIEQESSFRVDPSVPGLAGARAARDRPRAPSAPACRSCWPSPRSSCLSRRPHLQRAPRRRDDREGAVRPVRGFHRPRAARQVAFRRAQPGAHRRPDAGEHRLSPSATPRRASLSLRHDGSIRDEVFTPPRRPLLRHRAPLRLPRALRRPALPLRRLQRRALREPQRRVPERGGRAAGRRARARRRPAALRAGQADPRSEPHRDRGAHAGGAFRDDERRGAQRPRARAERRFERSRLYLSVFTMVDGGARPARAARGRADDRRRELQDPPPPDELRLRHARHRAPQGLPRRSC